MESLAIKIEKCSDKSAWYSKSIGSYFTVYNGRQDFIVKADYDAGYRAAWRHIDKEDCVILND